MSIERKDLLRFRGGVWPNHIQELFLRAAVCDRPDALVAWDQISKGIDIKKVDLASRQLLPLIYKNLKLNEKDPLAGSIKELYKIAVTKNRILLIEAAKILNALKAVSIDAMLLKGAALNLLYYEDHGVRMMEDVDILVKRPMASKAIDLLESLGFRALRQTIDSERVHYINLSNAHHFKNQQGLLVDLHWNIFAEASYEGADDDFWQTAVAIESNGINAAALCPTDQLLHLLAHGIKWNPTPPIRWVADAVTVIKRSAGPIDWARLRLKAEEMKLALPIKDAILYLRDRFGIMIPSDIVMHLGNKKASMLERLNYGIRTNRFGMATWMSVSLSRYLCYAWPRDERGFMAKVKDLFKYIQYECGLEHPRDLPFSAISALTGRLRAALGRQNPEK